MPEVPVSPGEPEAIAAFLQGSLLMHAYHDGIPGLAVSDVQQGAGPDGTYLPWFTVVTATGIRIRVIITPEDTP